MGRERGPTRWLRHLGIGRVGLDESVQWEIEHHLAELVDRLVAEGLERDEAERVAARRFGDVQRYSFPMRWLERWRRAQEGWARARDVVRQSLTSVVRGAARYPGYTAGVVLTLGLGLGANATMYGIVDRLLLSAPEHILRPDRVKRAFLHRPNPVSGEGRAQVAFAYPDYEDLKAHSALAVAGYEPGGRTTVGEGADATRARTMLVTAEFFPLLGVRPHLGRFFSGKEAAAGSPLTAVISYEFWQRSVGSDPDVIGRVIQIGDDRVPVIGVTPENFTGVDLAPIDIVMPVEASYALHGGEECLHDRGCYFLWVVVRLEEGAGLDAAEAEATNLHLNGRRNGIEDGRYPESAAISFAPLTAGPYDSGPSAESRVAGWLMGVSLIVLLIACANVANLLFARVTQQRRETAVRLALGVSGERLVAQAMLNSTTLALTGGAVALGIALWGGQAVRRMLLPDVFFPDSALSLRIVGFTVIVSVLAGLVSGLGPAVQAARPDLAADLTASGRGLTARPSRLRDLLTASQAALSVVLLVGAGLFVRSLTELRGLDLGLDADRLVVTDLEFVGGTMDAQTRREIYALAAQRVAALPQVEAVAGTAAPLGTGLAVHLRAPGVDSLPRFAEGGPYVFSVTPGYFEAAGLAITSGRAFAETDGTDAMPVAVVSETMADALWPDQQPVGRCLIIGSGPERCTTVVGVAENAARNGFTDGAYMGYYLPVSQAAALSPTDYDRAPNALYIRIRPGADASETVAAVAPILRALTPEVRWARVWPMTDTLDGQARSWTLGATMFIVFGLLAMSLAAIGLYAILAFDVAQRTRELGIRVALGAERTRLLRSVLYQGARVGGMGILVGLLVSYVTSPLLQDLLFEVSPRDPGVLGGVAIVLGVVCVVASVVPGLRATRVDPVTAIKSD